MPSISVARTHELELTKLFLIAYRRPNVRLFRRNIINTTVRHLHTDEVMTLKSGQVGQSDLYGFTRRMRDNTNGRSGRFGFPVPLEIELKGFGTPTSEEQLNWETWCKDWGIVYMRLRANKNETSGETCARWTFEVDRFLATAFAGDL